MKNILRKSNENIERMLEEKKIRRQVKYDRRQKRREREMIKSSFNGVSGL